MKDYTKAIKTLEYDKVLSLLAACCLTEGARQMALTASPEDDPVKIARMQQETLDARSLTEHHGPPSFGVVKDISDSVERAGKGAMLSPRELLDVADLLSSASAMHAYSTRRDIRLGCLAERFSRVFPHHPLEREIRRCILSEDSISDDASPKLSDIRRSIRLTNTKIRDTLQKFISAESNNKFLQDNLVTIRQGRYVIPVKTEHKNEVKGLVHDTSSSGATLFIEPMAVVEANNELRELESAEKKEIEKILYALSSQAADFGNALIHNYYTINEIAYIFARAELSYRMKATAPILSEDGVIDLKAARHPLLRAQKIVPIDIRLGGEFDTLVITGPNTGGKTVSLKTLGLFTLMAQTGLQIPAADESKLRIFSSVHADIGDEQSIEQSLSTFSAHMTHIVSILERCDENSLVLFDELCSGTDPTEGAALAVAIVEEVRRKGALCAATTHYSEMKIYALETDGVCNAACEFDVTTLAPTYRLILGAPGKSNAFAISTRLGLDDAIIRRASRLIDADSKRFEKVIEKLEENRIETEKKLSEAEELRASYQQLLKETEEKLQKKVAEAEKERDRATEQARRIIEGARATSDYVMAELEKAKKAKETAEFAKAMEEARGNIRRSMKESSETVNPVIERSAEDYTLPRPLKKGDEVVIISLNQKGVITALADKQGLYAVKAGIIQTRVPESDLMLAEDALPSGAKKEKKRPSPSASGSAGKTSSLIRDFASELDIRGMNGDDGWFTVDRYLDTAKMAGVHSVRIIHGKGTGALRKALWVCFKNDPRIASFRYGNYGEGDLGVTVVELK